MRQARSLKVLSVLWTAALPACIAGPTFPKWRFEISAYGEPLAVGGKGAFPGGYTKGCAASWAAVGGFGGCLDSPESDRGIEMTSAVVSDPTVFSVRPDGNKVLVEALREGEAELEVKARNRHGDVRSASRRLKALRPTEVRVQRKPSGSGDKPGCIGGRKPAKLWFPVGENFTLSYSLYAGDTRLVGLPLTVSARGTSGFREVSSQAVGGYGFDLGFEGTYVMSEPGTFTVSTPAFAAFSASGGAYTCQTLTGIGISRNPVGKAGNTYFEVVYMIGDDAVCSEPAAKCPVTLAVETPAVCTLSSTVSIRKLGAGTCRVSAALDGTPHRASLEIRL